MDETHVNWWMDDTSRWHRGFPPAGWWQAEDGRWHPPGDDDEPTEEMQEVPTGGAAHLAGPRSPTVVAGWGWPPWARIAVLTSIAILAVVVVAAAAITDSGGDGDGETVTADVSTTITPSTASTTSTGAPGSASSVASASPGDDTDPSAPPTTARSTTSAPPQTSAPTTTSPPPTDPGVRQGAPCSPEGATAVTQEGVPMTCTTQKCHGAPYDSARWRRTAC